MSLTRSEVEALADERYDAEGYENRTERLFAILVDVADAYVSALEAEADVDAAPFLGGTTPTEAAILGLRENLDIRREGVR